MTAPLRLAVNASATTPGAVFTTPLHQALLDLGAWTGISRFADRAARYRSRSAEVVVAPGRATRGDCFAFFSGATLALDVCQQGDELACGCDGGGAVVRRLTIEQPPRWQVPKPGTAPRRFSVYGVLAEDAAGDSVRRTFLGEFEYALAAPATQAFELSEPVRLRSLQLDFAADGWGESYTCVY